MGEYAFLAVLFAVAVATVVGGVILRRRLGPKIPVKGKRKGKAGAKEAFYQDGNEKVPDGDGEVWEDDDLYSLKDGKKQGVYMGDKEKIDDEEHESWDKY